jgi:hypothetical protein
MCQFKQNDSLPLLEKFVPNGTFNNTDTAPRALLVLAQCYSMIKGMQEKENRCYEYIVKKFPYTQEADNALFFIAQPYYYEADYISIRKTINRPKTGLVCKCDNTFAYGAKR